MRSVVITKKDICWNYLGYVFSVGINVFLLPLILHFLPTNELALWYVFMSVGTLVTLLDFGFSPQFTRAITYSVSGVKEIKSIGITDVGSSCNPELVRSVVLSCKVMYLGISLCAFLLLITLGTIYIMTLLGTLPLLGSLIAWWVYCIACFINIYYNYYSAILRGIGSFEIMSKANVLSKIAQLVIALLLLLIGLKLIAVSISYFCGVLIFRLYLHYKVNICKTLCVENIDVTWHSVKGSFSYIKKIWHNAWKEGAIALSRFMITQGNILLCSVYLGLSITASFGLMLQLLSVISSVSSIYFNSIYPKLSEANVYSDKGLLLNLFSKSWSIYLFSYAFLFCGLYFLGLSILSFLKPDILISDSILLFLALYVFLENNHSLFASYISTSNKLPYTSAFVISSVLSFGLSFFLLNYVEKSIWMLLIPMFVVQLLYNNWKWPLIVLRHLNVDVCSFIKIGFSNFYLKNTKIVE